MNIRNGDVMNAKADIYLSMCEADGLSADKRWAAYQEALGMYVSRRLSKRELDTVVLRVIGVDNIRKHNALLLALLADATRRAVDTRNRTVVGVPRHRLVLPLEPEAKIDDAAGADDELAALRREWRKTGLMATAPLPHKNMDVPRKNRGLVANARLDGASLVALKMDDISIGLGLDGASASAVHLMTLALHTYARRMMKQCHAEFTLQRRGAGGNDDDDDDDDVVVVVRDVPSHRR
ncbi:hypothetical protein CTAYLR_004205 [Chrysophaeum taylorii]|uniref:Uncharacterized protein n=1 Tax=Chrysophaeum taylorii TaxID=2483200 RepID=A0AAD7XI44_9STRA|nr:hypothetical protein CTAYLR_004205 [Chrysophaeum taylorii]